MNDKKWKGDSLIEGYIEQYVSHKAESLRRSLEIAKNDNSYLFLMVKEATSKGIKVQPHINRASILYYDKYIKNENLLPRKSSCHRKQGSVTLRMKRIRDSEATINLPLIFPKQERKVRDFKMGIKKPKKELKRERSQSSCQSRTSFITSKLALASPNHENQHGKRVTVGQPLDHEDPELKLHFKSICLSAGDGTFFFTHKGFMSHLCKRYSDKAAGEIARALNFPERTYYKDFVHVLDVFLSRPRAKALKLAFDIYDEDNDKLISEKDLYVPFVGWPNELYEEVFLFDLPKILSQLNMKISLNKNKEEHSATHIHEKDSLVFKEFARIFEQNYPEIINDLLYNLIKRKCEQKELLAFEEDKENEKTEPWKDRDICNKVAKIIGDKEKEDKIISVFKVLAANPAKGEHLMYLTLGSLTKNFERVFGYTNKYLLYRFFRILFKDNVDTDDQKKIGLLSYIKSIRPLFDTSSRKATSWAFRMYDSNEDGYLGIAELTSFQKEIPCPSRLHEEIQSIINDYMSANVYKTAGAQPHEVDERTFSYLTGNDSVLSKEFANKLAREKMEEWVVAKLPTEGAKLELSQHNIQRKVQNHKRIDSIEKEDGEVEKVISKPTQLPLIRFRGKYKVN